MGFARHPPPLQVRTMRFAKLFGWAPLSATLLCTSCVSYHRYRSTPVDVSPTVAARQYPVPLLFSKLQAGDLSQIMVRDLAYSVDAGALESTLRSHAMEAIDRSALFTRTLGPEDPMPVTFVEVSGRLRDFQITADSSVTLRTTGTVELHASIWPSAATIWKSEVSVGPNDYEDPVRGTSGGRRVGRQLRKKRINASIDDFVGRIATRMADALAQAQPIATAVNDLEPHPIRRRRGPAPDAMAPAAVVAIFDLEAKGLRFESDELARLTEYLGATLTESGRFEVVPRQALMAVLRKQKKESYADCYAESCQIEVGKELAAEKTLSGSIIEFANQCIVTLRLFDLKKATQESAGTERSTCEAAAILTAIDGAMGKLTATPSERSPSSSLP